MPIFTGADGALPSRYHGRCLNDYFLSILLGIVEGLTEFLPVSSTAHLRIAEALLNVDLGDGYWKMFSIVIQLGAILCLPIYFWDRIMSFLATFPKGARGDKTAITHPLGLTLIAFVCTAVPAFLLTKVIGKNLESLVLMASALIIGGIVMWIVDAMFGAEQRRRLRSRGRRRNGAHDAAAGDLDRPVPDTLRRFSGHFALDGDDCGRSGFGIVADRGAGIFFPAVDPDDDCGDRLRSVESGEGSRTASTSIRTAGCCWQLGSLFRL